MTAAARRQPAEATGTGAAEETTAEWTPGNRAALARFLREHGLGGGDASGGDLDIRRVGDGHSNLTFAVTSGTNRIVVRRPPLPPSPPGAHDVLREARLMAALRDTPVPVPAVLATARVGEVIDVPLYVMSFAEGLVVTTVTPAPLGRPATRRQIGEALIDTLADLHAVDWRAVGLADLGRPDGFNARHLRRIAGLVVGPGGDPPPLFAAAGDWLAKQVPPESGASIVHSDYRIGNVVLAPGPPGRVAAVLDWELATIGDPLLDVAYFLASVPGRRQSTTPVRELSTALQEDGYPARQELAARYAARYAERTGRDLPDLTWYTVMALWKLAVLYEYGRRRAVRDGGDAYYADRSLVLSFLNAAHRAAALGPVRDGETS
ncbi:MAG TPA: phosphotransferase family protein [Trebonia sp.]|jgi:aminoglycoside phosphotransferase (APT) family kinase protein|nr:phosphotransferase family protein [Trebonia sp.]